MHRSVFNEEINVVFKSQLSNYMKVALLQVKKGFKMLYFETVLLNEHSLTHTHDPAHTLSLSLMTLCIYVCRIITSKFQSLTYIC